MTFANICVKISDISQIFLKRIVSLAETNNPKHLPNVIFFDILNSNLILDTQLQRN